MTTSPSACSATPGATVDGDRVRFDPGHVRSLCATAPAAFTQVARDPAHTVEIGGDAVVFAPAYGSPFVRDLAGGRRYGSLADFENFVKLAWSIPWLHHSGGTVCEPVDVPVNKRHLDMVYAHLRYSAKPFMGSVTVPSRAEDSVAMARVAFGADFLESNCVILGNVNVNSPLVWDGAMTGAIRAYASANQAPVVVPFILGGAMGPVTLAGGIAQSHAETMVGVALGQLVRPGSPVCTATSCRRWRCARGRRRSGRPSRRSARSSWASSPGGSGLPLRCSGSFTTAKVLDGQAMLESAVSMQAAILCGANFILHSAGWLEGGLVMGYEKFVVDADHCGALHRYLRGIELTDEEFAMDGFREVGPGKHFFGAQHTLRHYETAFWDSWTADNSSFEQWRDAGERHVEERAADKVAELLAAYEPPPIDPAVDEALRDFVARRKADMPDMWV